MVHAKKLFLMLTQGNMCETPGENPAYYTVVISLVTVHSQ